MEIRKYESKDKDQIIRLLSTEWNFDLDLFNWKYEFNPFSSKPYAYVCLDKDKIVGFRGFYEMSYLLGGSTIKVLSPSDVFVSKDFRRQGIFNKMNSFALKDIKKSPITPLFLNLSSNEKSTPGYLKMGWKEGFQKNLFVYKNLPGLTKGRSTSFSFVNSLFIFFMKKRDYGNSISVSDSKVLVSRKAYPRMMNNLWKRLNDNSKISLFKSIKFFDWTVKNPKSKRFFIYNLDYNGNLVSYVILKKIGKKKYFVLDYEYTNVSHLEYLIKSVMDKCPSLFLMHVSYNSSLEGILSQLGFFKNTFIYKLFDYNIFRTPVLLRPKNASLENSWHLEGLDILSKDTWYLNHINEDGN